MKMKFDLIILIINYELSVVQKMFKLLNMNIGKCYNADCECIYLF